MHSCGCVISTNKIIIKLINIPKIIPIFIFDGKPPPEKRELLQRRRMEKKEAEENT